MESKIISAAALAKVLGKKSSVYVKADDPTHYEICMQIRDLFADWHKESAFRDTPFSADRIEQVVNNLWNSKANGLLLGAFESGSVTTISGKRLTTKDRLVGVMAARAGPQLFSDQYGATVEHWFVHPDYRTTTAAVKLLVSLRMWAKKNGCVTLVVPTNSGVKLKQTDKLLRKLGYAMVGGTYASPIN